MKTLNHQIRINLAPGEFPQFDFFFLVDLAIWLLRTLEINVVGRGIFRYPVKHLRWSVLRK